MTAAVFHDEYKPVALQCVLDARESYLRVRLFKNDATVARDNTLASYTAADFSGYSVQTPTFPDATLDDDDEGSSEPDPVTFTHDGGGTSNLIYGWVLYDSNNGKVLFAKKFGSPVTMEAEGDYIAVVLPLKVREVA